MASGRAGYGIDCIHYAMQGSVRTDGHISAEHIIVNRTHQSDDRQMLMSLRNFLVYFTGSYQVFE